MPARRCLVEFCRAIGDMLGIWRGGRAGVGLGAGDDRTEGRGAGDGCEDRTDGVGRELGGAAEPNNRSGSGSTGRFGSGCGCGVVFFLRAGLTYAWKLSSSAAALLSRERGSRGG